MSEETISEFNLSALSPVEGSRHRRKRVGIGEGSGKGKTCGKGQKGQKSRSGFSLLKGFEGGQMPLHRRVPKRGFTSRRRTLNKNVFKVVNLERLESLCDDSGSLKVESLFTSGELSRTERLKVLGGGKIDKKLSVEVHAVSASAKHAIESAGGEVKVIAPAEDSKKTSSKKKATDKKKA